jgi:hypothetical protein
MCNLNRTRNCTLNIWKRMSSHDTQRCKLHRINVHELTAAGLVIPKITHWTVSCAGSVAMERFKATGCAVGGGSIAGETFICTLRTILCSNVQEFSVLALIVGNAGACAVYFKAWNALVAVYMPHINRS